jgi:hypothetical protein
VAAAGAEAVDSNIRDQVDFEGGNIVHRSEGFANRVIAQGQQGAADGLTEEQRAAQAESVRRATGGGTVVIQREEGEDKLPGT